MAARHVRLRLLAAFLAFAAGAVAVTVVVLLAHSALSGGLSAAGAAPAAAAPSSSSTPSEPAFPAPPAGALVLAREDRDLVVGLAVAARRAGGLALQASVIGQEQPAARLSVSFRLPGGTSVTARPCGAGCYRALVDPHGSPRAVQVAIRGPGRPASTVSFPIPASAPGPPATALVHRAETTWHALETLVVHDSLSSGSGATIHTTWQLQAPDRLTYRIRKGPDAIVIAGRRWDRVAGQGWQASRQDPIRQPVPLWGAVTNARLLGSVTVRRRPAWEISFFDPRIHAWFTIRVDKATMRTLELRMVAQAHFMHQVYGPFDSPLRIVPPTKATP